MKNKKGLTLVEVVVAMGLFGIIMVSLFPAFIITNLMNNISKEFTDANVLAQSEIEEIYNLSKEDDADISTILEDRGFDCSTLPCNKDNTEFLYEITYTEDSPITNMTKIVLIVSNLTGDINYQGDRAQIELVLRIGN